MAKNKNPMQPTLRQRKALQGEEQLAKVVLRPRNDELGEAFPNDWFEGLVFALAMIAVIGGLSFIVHLANT